MCSFSMLWMALDKIPSSFMPSDIFIRNVKKNKQKTITTRQPVRWQQMRHFCCLLYSYWKDFLFKLISPHFQVELILSETMVFYRLRGQSRHLSKCQNLITIDRWSVSKVVPLCDVISPTGGSGELNHLKGGEWGPSMSIIQCNKSFPMKNEGKWELCRSASVKALPLVILNVFQHPHSKPGGRVRWCIYNSSLSAYVQRINTATNVEVASYNGWHSVAC